MASFLEIGRKLRSNPKYNAYLQPDFTLVLDDQTRIDVHKVALAAISTFFDRLFDYEEKESRLVMTPKELNWILDWAYLHQIDLNKKIVTDVIILANYVDAPELMSACIDFISAEASLMNLSELENLKAFANFWQLLELEETVQGHVIRRKILITNASLNLFTE